MADIFNNYYYLVDIEKNIAASIGGNNKNYINFIANINQPNSFFFRPIHCNSIEKIICSLKNKSTNLKYNYSCDADTEKG